jgi:hypothetical protein
MTPLQKKLSLPGKSYERNNQQDKKILNFAAYFGVGTIYYAIIYHCTSM